MSEEPTETAPQPDEDTEEPEEPGAPESPPSPEDAAPAPAPVEPRLGLGDFAAVATLDKVTQAGLRTWMRTKGLRPDGHYPLAQWQEWHQGLLRHAG